MSEMTPCRECGMICDPAEYHPFGACLMFKACHDGDQVRANLEAIRATPPQPGAQGGAWIPIETAPTVLRQEREAKERVDRVHRFIHGAASHITKAERNGVEFWLPDEIMSDGPYQQGYRACLADIKRRILAEDAKAAAANGVEPAFDVWEEGFRATGDGAGATFLGRYACESFREACFLASGNFDCLDPSREPRGYSALFQTAAEARRSFG